jgi:hypothetical protein
VLLYTPGGAVVEASTIFSSLRQTLLDGFELTLEDIGDEGVRVSGKLVLDLEGLEITEASGTPTIDPSKLQLTAIYAELDVKADESSDELSGLDVHTVMALRADTLWIYLKMAGLPHRVLEEQPMAGVALWLTGRGMLVDLTEVRDLLDIDELDIFGKPVFEESEAEFEIIGLPGADGELGMLFTGLLYGRAGAAEIDQLVKEFSEAARHVVVAEVEPGLHVLTARDFTPEAEDMNSEEAAMLARITLEITYREGAGVESAAVRNIGAYGGAVQIAPIKGEVDPSLFEKERLIEPGVTTVLDAATLRPLLEQVQESED